MNGALTIKQKVSNTQKQALKKKTCHPQLQLCLKQKITNQLILELCCSQAIVPKL